MTLNRTRRALCAALAVAGVLAPVAAAEPSVKKALFHISVQGTQMTTWRTKVPGHPPCAAGISIDGDQTMQFQTEEPFGLTARLVSGTRTPELVTNAKVHVEVDRNVTYHTGIPIVKGRTCVGFKPQTEPEPNCGRRGGHVDVDLSFETTDEVLGPLAGPNEVFIRSSNPDYLLGHLHHLYGQCPMFVADPEYAPSKGEMLEAAAHIDEQQLFSQTKVIRLHFSRSEDLPGAVGATGQTRVTYNVTLTRVG